LTDRAARQGWIRFGPMDVVILRGLFHLLPILRRDPGLVYPDGKAVYTGPRGVVLDDLGNGPVDSPPAGDNLDLFPHARGACPLLRRHVAIASWFARRSMIFQVAIGIAASSHQSGARRILTCPHSSDHG
jgi:hypothetical protein